MDSIAGLNELTLDNFMRYAMLYGTCVMPQRKLYGVSAMAYLTDTNVWSVKENSFMDDLVQGADYPSPSIGVHRRALSARLNDKKIELENELARVNDAIEKLGANPEVQAAFDAVTQVL